MARVLITGNAGFIGSNVADRLLKDNHKVYGIDNFRTGKKKNIHKDIEWIKGDITVKEELESAFELYRPEMVIHIAGNASIINSVEDPRLDANINTMGTLNVIEKCKKWGVRKLIYASSMTVYGDQKPPFSSSDNCAQPQTNYSISKYAAERYVIGAGDEKLATVIFRMFNVYGPRQDIYNPYQGVLAILLGKIINHEKFTIYGDGYQRRDFVYIDDVVEAYAKAVNEYVFDGEITDIGSGYSTSVSELIMEANQTGAVLSMDYYPARFEEQKDSFCDASKFDEEKWNPKTKFRDGFRKTIEWAQGEKK